MGRIVNIEFRGLHKAFGQLRSHNDRGLVAAYRFGELVKVLHKQGYTWEELGDEIDRKADTMRLYVKLFNSYETERDLLDTAEQMKTWSVSKLAGHTSMVPIQYVLHCTNCGAFEGIKRERKHEDDPPITMPIVAPKFQAPPSLQAMN
jgi:hypothetical protein